MKTTIVATLIVVGLLVSSGILAQPQETRELEADLDGSAINRQTGSTHDLTLNLTGDVIVTEPENGVSRTAFSPGPDVEARVQIDGVGDWIVPVRVNGEGVSLVQTGVTADGWRLSFQGTGLPTPGADPESVQLRGSLILLGNDDGGYLANGEGFFTVPSGQDTTSYNLTYGGSATFS